MKRINSKRELTELARELGVRDDWHEPDEQGLTAEVFGRSFDNAGFWGDGTSDGKPYEEMHVEIRQNARPVAVVNLATLFAWATGLEDS